MNDQLIQVKRISDESERGVSVSLVWKNAGEAMIPSKVLRNACPCATCQQLRGDTSHNKPLSSSALDPISAPAGKGLLKVLKQGAGEEENLQLVRTVGNYALSFVWGDMHDSGIYSFGLLYRLSFPEGGPIS